MYEARNLFKNCLKTEALQKTQFILFLNKNDIFKEKMKNGNIKKYITKYQGNVTDADEAAIYIEKNIFRKVVVKIIVYDMINTQETFSGIH